MKIDRRLFRSKLAHRVFLAFILCALIPILIVGVVSYRSVSDQLVNQATLRLRSASKGLGLSLYERLLFADAELSTMSLAEATQPQPETGKPRAVRFREIRVLEGEERTSALGTEVAAAVFERRQRDDHLAGGGSVLLALTTGSESIPVFLAKLVNPDDPESHILAGELNPAYLWGLDGGNSVPAGSEFCVLDRQGRLIFGSFGKCGEAWAAFGDDHVAQDEIGIRAAFPVVGEEDGEFIAGRWDLFLGARFFAPDWMIIVSEPRDSVVQPIRRWRVVFPAVVLLAFWVVLLLIIGAIRRNLDPIDRLREATDHLADRDFDFRVDIRSGDEFEELAKAFNQMSSKLRRQFSALAATGKIHRAILSAMETDQVVEEAVVGVLNYFECDRAAIVVVDPDEGGAGRTVVVSGSPEPEYSAAHVVSPHLTASLKQIRPGQVLGHDLSMPGELTDLLTMAGMDTVLAVPITARDKIAAVVGLGFEDRRELPEDELDQLTQLADQFAVAHSNATMLQEVNGFSLGTLEALARAVDAKSPWTAGHSERVTRLAVTIGAAYGLDPYELSKLHRGAMLHDIGKLGISQTLLDKKGRLDHDEFSVVRSHTMIGERILEPVGAFSELMPIVTQHHERFDGSGYPTGMTGSKIDIKARILAVADVYDAMTNPRPYRDSVDPSEVVEMIREQSGSQFDPEVVEAFLTVIDSTGGFIDSATPRRGFSFLIRRGAEHQRATNDGETGGGT